MLLNTRKNYISKCLIFNISILLLLQQFSFAQSNSNVSSTKQQSSKFNKKALYGIKPFKPGDGLYISTFPDTTSFLNNIFSIDDMGYVDFPIVGRSNVSSKTEDELITFLKSNFQQYMRTPNVTVKPMIRVSLIGGFNTPGLYYFDYSASVWDAIQRAGGPTLEDGLKDMVWERDRDEVVDDLLPYFEKGVSLKNMGFRSGDQLVTPSDSGPSIGETIEGTIGVLSFFTGIFMIYMTYQQMVVLSQYGR